VVSDFRLYVNEIGGLLGFHAAYNSSYLPTFRDNLSVSSSSLEAAQISK